MIRLRIFVIVVGLAVSYGSLPLPCEASPNQSPIPRAESGKKSRERKAIIGYIFAREGNPLGEGMEAGLLTHINYAFANIKGGKLVTEKPADRANLGLLASLRTRFTGLKVLISVGGWSWSGGFSDMSLTRSSRAIFINSALEFLRQYDLDGIDLDWEYPGLPGAGNPNRPEDRQNFTLLLRELRKALNTFGSQTHRKYLLTIAAGASPSYLENTEMRKAQKSLDYVNLMTYDFFVEEGGESGHHSNLYPSAFDTAAPSGSGAVREFLRAGVPARKLVLGVPFYGRGWTAARPDNNGLYQKAVGANGDYSWNNLIQSYIARNGYTRWWDTEAKAPYLWKPDESRIVSYDDPESLKEKCAFVKRLHLGGIMFWEYSADDSRHTLLRTLYEGLQGSR